MANKLTKIEKLDAEVAKQVDAAAHRLGVSPDAFRRCIERMAAEVMQKQREEGSR